MLSTIAVTPSPTPSSMASSYAHVPGAAYILLAKTRAGKMDTALQISEICSLITDYCLWSQMYRQRVGGHCCHNSLHCCKPLPLWLKWLLGDLKDQWFFSFSFFSFSHLHSKANSYMGEIRKALCMAREKHSLRKDLRRTEAHTSAWSSAQRQLTKAKKTKTKIKPSKPWEGRRIWVPDLLHYYYYYYLKYSLYSAWGLTLQPEIKSRVLFQLSQSGTQTYYIIKFKCPVFNKNNNNNKSQCIQK